ncbi:alpha/beta-hydrolase [Macrolepiota fuliginosa MF-IS2]|uniref:Alpha/beta-hydrolase n=1 Tax=Macrolepiota fuliginosa MF-IS2 TaxID=1400762 RepID=A0A9P6C284_9AGAR|nr:alpha/beta-hydrolase [Macrolepiota fuliginosa MF-IS2]
MTSPQWPGLSPEVTSRMIVVGDLNVHILECLPLTNHRQTDTDNPTQRSKPPLIVLLHGFPELAYSWRKIFVPLAKAGYHVIAPDQRGYGLTTPLASLTNSRVAYEDDLRPYHILNLAADVVHLIYALGYEEAHAVVGHDFGSNVAGWCALVRPDVVKRLVLMSAPFGGPPKPQDARSVKKKEDSRVYLVDAQLRKLEEPRKHYTVYYSTPQANNDMCHPSEGLKAFLRAYYHVKSAEWEGNWKPAPGPLSVKLNSGSQPSKEDVAEAVARAMEILPHYYIMPANLSMPAAVRPHLPTPGQKSVCTWLTDEELDVYTSIYSRTGFQGGLNRYRTMTDETWNSEAGVRAMCGKKVEVSTWFISGQMDWGVWQSPGAIEALRSQNGVVKGGMQEEFLLVEGAGHWVQQEKPEEVVRYLVAVFSRD